ncbi:adenosine receptor A2b-like [Exaiptasia diaphana]|uniref:G-protein coupled receptors family 1 profile domain-containing protein n=1 Tax=Exaiptasia diaphana TaxID=2652724 RepID=A0A913XE39_EXADI|nr:adenosine receptor A2b-like [Exaiptasia diaphana]
MNHSSYTTSPSSPGDGDKCFFLPEPQFNRVEDERYSTNVTTALINFAMIPFALCSNFLIVSVITRNPSFASPSNVLLACLAVSDFLVGLIVQPLYSCFRILENTRLYVPCPFRVVYSESFWICYGVSFMTLSALSCERYLALRLHLRYRELVTTQGVLHLVAIIWIFDVILTSLQWVDHGSFVRHMQISIFLLCVFLTVIVQFKIFGIIRHHQRQITEQTLNPSQVSFAAIQTKLAKNMAYIVGFYLMFNLPVLVVQMCQFAGVEFSSLNVFSWVETIAFTKSSVNPVICGWRNAEIRQEVIKKLRKCFRREIAIQQNGIE